MRRRVTVIILVVVLVLTGGLVAATIPRVRQAAARMQCQNNLKQLGIALHDYTSANSSSFPAATIRVEGLPLERRLSWFVSILPYMDQVGLGIDRTKAWDAEENMEPTFFWMEDHTRMVSRPVGECKMFRCPLNSATAEPGSPGLTHYVGMAGLGIDADGRSAGYPGVGFFGHDRQTRLEDVKDGAATTIMVIETSWKNGPWTAGGYPTVRGLELTGEPYLGAGGQFGSNHTGGSVFSLSRPTLTNALFVDGSVRSLTNAIKPEVFEALATIAGGEDVGEALDR
jgi:hypothetical protein